MKKIALIFALGFSVNTAFANDLRDTSLYTPGGKYRMFGSGRGTVEKVKNNIRRTSTISYDNGPTHVDIHHYSGQLTYEQSFSNHPLSEHGSFSNSSAMRVIDSYGTITAGKITATNARIKGREVHPDDAYDAADGGDHPYDAYSYHVDGEVRTTSIRPVGLPKQTVPTMTRYDDNGNAVTGNSDNQLPEKGSADANNMNDRTRDLVGAGNPNLPNGSSDVANGEVPLPKDVTKNNDSWLPDVSVDLVANGSATLGMGAESEVSVNIFKIDKDDWKASVGWATCCPR